MPRISNCVMALAGAALAVPATAAVVTDNFNAYTANDPLNGLNGGTGSGINWTSAWTATTTPKITAAALEGSLGVGVSGTSNANALATRTFDPQSGTLYASALINISALDSGDFFVFQLSDTATGNVAHTASFGIQNNASNTFLTRFGSSNTPNQASSATGASANTTYLLVARISKGNTALRDGSNNIIYDKLDLWVDPTSEASPLATTLNLSSTAKATLTQLQTLNIRTVDFADTVTLRFDDVRIGTTFAEVVPEPASVWTLGLGAMMFLRRSTRRRK